MGRRVSYPVEVKLKAIEMRLAGVPIKEVMETLQIRNYTQLKTWMRWHRDGESYRLAQLLPISQDNVDHLINVLQHLNKKKVLLLFI